MQGDKVYEAELERSYQYIAETIDMGAAKNPNLNISTSKEAINEISVMIVELMLKGFDFIEAWKIAATLYSDKTDNS